MTEAAGDPTLPSGGRVNDSSMTTPSKMLELTGLRCTGLRKRRYYCIIQFGAMSFKTSVSPETKDPSWDGSIRLLGDASSIIINVRRQRMFFCGKLRSDSRVAHITVDQLGSQPTDASATDRPLVMEGLRHRWLKASISFVATQSMASSPFSPGTTAAAKPEPSTQLPQGELSGREDGNVPNKGSENEEDPFGANGKLRELVHDTKADADAMRSAPDIVETVADAIQTGKDAAESHSDAFESWKFLLDKLQFFVTISDGLAQIHPYAQAALSIISAVPKAIIEQTGKDAAIRDLVKIINRTLKLMDEAEPLRQEGNRRETASLIAQQIGECAKFVSDYAKTEGFTLRLAKNFGCDVEGAVAEYKKCLEVLIEDFECHTSVATNIVVLEVLESARRVDQNVIFRELPVASGSGFDPDKGCLPKTRIPLINLIIDWIDSPDEANSQRVFWLRGPAGAGKSAIAHTIAKHYNDKRRLGSMVCFNAAGCKIEQLFPTLSFDLSDFDRGWRKALWEAVKDNSNLRHTHSLQLQFDGLFLGPAKAVAEHSVSPIVIILDALDESGKESERSKLLPYILRLQELPNNFRFLVTSRDEKDIRDKLTDLRCVRQQNIAVYNDTVDHDIALFVREDFSAKAPHIVMDARWKGESMVQEIVKAAEKSFQWAFTACSFIRGEDKYKEYDWHDRFLAVLSSGSSSQDQESGVRYSHLDTLYKLVLGQLFGDGPSDRFKRVLGCVLSAKVPLPLDALEELQEEKDPRGCTTNVLNIMGSLLYGVSNPGDPIRPLHSSFRDFLTDNSRSGAYCVNLMDANELLAHSTLRIMRTSLRFNICHLASSYDLNDEYDDLDQRILNNVTSGLIYAVCYWAQHIVPGPGATLSPELLTQIEGFFKTRALFWLESLSLLNSLQSGSSALLTLKRALTGNDEASDVLRLVEDLDRFLSLYWDVISISAPHIYLSALSFTPETSLVSQNYMESFPNSARVLQGRLAHWPALRCTMQGHRGVVRSVKFSHDGKWIVSGSHDCTIRMWDAESGQAVGKPFEGHTDTIYSVAFSSDGRRIISASADNTIRMWDTAEGKAIGEPFRGHTVEVNSVAFSPQADDPRAVSGANDSTIRLWDTSTGKMLGERMNHTHVVMSVGFSPDGTRLVSGSEDHTIRIWDAQSQKLVAGPLSGHGDTVLCVAFSPDSMRVMSGSRDGTIRIWDAESGQTIVGPLVGHTRPVTSASFSPDGKYIVSGSVDDTIRLWDAKNGAKLGEPVHCQSIQVLSVAYSPDGSRIASGSWDGHVRVWHTAEMATTKASGTPTPVMSIDVTSDGSQIVAADVDGWHRCYDTATQAAIGNPFGGDELQSGNTLWCVAFSPDGSRIISGYYDGSIRLWDVERGTVIGEPWKGPHKGLISSILFTPSGQQVISGSWDGTICVWDVETGKALGESFSGHDAGVTSLALSPIGKRLISGSKDHTIRVWDVEIRQPVGEPLQGHTNEVSSVAYSSDGSRIVSGSDDVTVRLWDAESGDPIGEPLVGRAVNSVAFCSHDEYVISGSWDGTVRIWGVGTTSGPLVAVSRGHSHGVASVKWSSKTSCIVSGSWDGSVRSWDIRELIGKPTQSLMQDQTAVEEPMFNGDTGTDAPLSSELTSSKSTDEDTTSPDSPSQISICFSSAPEHQLRDAHTFFPNGEPGWSHARMKASFGLASWRSDNKGWILGPDDERLLWVPQHSRWNLWQPASRLFLPSEETTMLDLSRFVHGERWAECYKFYEPRTDEGEAGGEH
ncbi:WD40 repeat-like protein [Punctularia strigosozonata HHB-11173 SS5]|uniref:WD40 repeat-like protein n=1 Tax=Punctularia strigosozonata (strain HHB-11173) TaxID=741275 RepID=UPI0004417027|nr:WD40 repeat-like protein [Punctularia strigosozonata HHB-11173 SS5]EIN05905.1 WD40 repeat-like protein [Punctularia strigosozonata HHB-11173 SS5]